MSFQGKENGQNLPAWVQKTVEKSRNGFNRVHEELKRMYNDSLQLVTVTRPDDRSKVDSVVTKSNGFVRKLVRFVGSFKETIHRYNRRTPIEFVSESEPIYDTADSLEQPQAMTEVAGSEDKKTLDNGKSEHRVPKNKLTSKSKSKGPMPHSELLKSTVYVNDRVLEERVDGKIKDKDNENNGGESGTLYAEIDDEDTSDEKSDTGDPIHQSLLDLRQSCISTQRQNQKSKPKIREEESYCALKTEKQSQKGDLYSTLTKEDNLYTELTKDNRRVSASIESQTETKDASNISRYSKMSRSLPALSNPPGKAARRRRDVVSDRKHDAPAKYKSKTVSYHEKEVKHNAKTEQRDRSNNEVAVEEDADKAAEVRSLYEYTVEEVAECFKQCAFIGLAQTCLDEKLDGEYFRDISAEDLKREPFHMNWFHINKLFKVFNGWRPKRSVSHE